MLSNSYLGHVNVTLKSRGKKKKIDLNGQFVLSSPVIRLQTGTAELVILSSWKKQTNKQTKNWLPSGAGVVHMDVTSGHIPKQGAWWFRGIPVLRHNFWSCPICTCHVISAIIQCHVSGVFCTWWYLCLPLRVLGTLPAFSSRHSTDGNVWARFLLSWVHSGALHCS